MGDLEQRVRAAVERAVETGEAPGAAWAVVSGRGAEREVVQGSSGIHADDTIFRIASLTKPIVGVLLAALVEDGVLGLDDPVKRWVPEIADRQVLRTPDADLDDLVPPQRDLTVLDVALMGAGVGWGEVLEGTALQRATQQSGIESTWQPSELDPDAWVRRLADLPMAHQPGEGWLYQVSYDLLAIVLERATDRRLDEALAERLLNPLGMDETGWATTSDRLPRVPAQFFPNFKGRSVQVAPEADPSLLEQPVSRSGATGLLSTAADLARFGAFLLDAGQGPQGRVIGAQALADAVRDRLPQGEAGAMSRDSLEPTQGWGLGVAVDLAPAYDGAHTGRFGWYGGTGTTMWTDPAAGVSGVLLTQNGPPSQALSDLFWRAVHGS